MGALVDEVTAYETLEVSENKDELVAQLKDGAIDVVTFTSSSTVKNFAALLPEGQARDIMKKVRVAAIGPITADTARDLGFDVDICAESYTIPGLVDAILGYYGGK